VVAVAGMKLSPHFTLEEMTRSHTALRLAIDNTPDEESVESLSHVCLEILEPVRENYGVPFSPSSGYRSNELNQVLGGSKNSQHCRGQAADFEIPGASNLEVADWIRNKLEFDQLILEYFDHEDPSKGWVHSSVVGGSPEGGLNRFEVLTFDGIIYHHGLPMDD